MYLILNLVFKIKHLKLPSDFFVSKAKHDGEQYSLFMIFSLSCHYYITWWMRSRKKKEWFFHIYNNIPFRHLKYMFVEKVSIYLWNAIRLFCSFLKKNNHNTSWSFTARKVKKKLRIWYITTLVYVAVYMFTYVCTTFIFYFISLLFIFTFI